MYDIMKRGLLYLILAFVINMMFCPNCLWTNFEQWTWLMIYSLTICILLSEGNRWLGSITNKPEKWLNNPVKQFILGSCYILLFNLPAIFFLNYLFMVLIPGKTWKTIFSEQFYFAFLMAVLIMAVITLFMYCLHFVNSWRELALKAEQAKTSKINSQLTTLRNQIKPHFLFNSLNTLTSLVHIDQRKSVEFINHLASLYRYILDFEKEELVSLKKEVGFLKAYIFLLEIRFSTKLKVHLEVQSTSKSLPPYTLQLLVENAIKHNTISSSKPLTVKIRQQNDRIIVENNLQPKKVETDSTGIGLLGIRKNYEVYDAQILIEDGPELFRVSVPLLNIEQYAHINH